MQKQESIVAGNVQKLRNIEWRISRTFNADELLKVLPPLCLVCTRGAL